jgi:Na+-transporting NADH:ubiquinone oxidoreductase subunit NqrF
MAFFEDFENWARVYPGFKFIPTIDDKSDKNWKYNFGYITKELLIKYIRDLNEPIYYIVGPLAMVDAMEALLLGLGVSKDKIKLERF